MKSTLKKLSFILLIIGLFGGSTISAQDKVDKLPEIVGGVNALAKFIKYPAEALKNDVQGKVILTATIGKKGELLDVKVIRSVGSGCDEAAIVAIKKVEFTPGEKDGKKVKTEVTIPVMFKLS